jgi:hypothetical protein
MRDLSVDATLARQHRIIAAAAGSFPLPIGFGSVRGLCGNQAESGTAIRI